MMPAGKKHIDFYNNRDSAGGPVLITSRNRFARLKCQIATLKKGDVEFYTSISCKVRALIVGQNPFSQRKNLPDTGETQLIPTGEIDQKIDTLLTTDHMFHVGRPRFATVFATELRLFRTKISEKSQPGGRGASARMWEKCFDRKAHTEILFVLVPLPPFCRLKKLPGIPRNQQGTVRQIIHGFLAPRHHRRSRP